MAGGAVSRWSTCCVTRRPRTTAHIPVMTTNPNRVPKGVTTGGQFSTGHKSESSVSLAGGVQPREDASPESFSFNKDYNDHEQVRPYFDAYTKVYDELQAAGQYPYDSLFKGRIPGIEGPSEDTAIYMLQQMRSREALAVRRNAFEESGGKVVTADDMTEGEIRRGTVASAGFYMGGTGWTEYDKARLVKNNGRLVVLEKGKRTNGRLLQGDVLLRED